MWGGTPAFLILGGGSNISIHPPHVGWDVAGTMVEVYVRYFNPPTPCGVGPTAAVMPLQYPSISIHPPHVGWDVTPKRYFCGAVSFQSTHPMWGGTDFLGGAALEGIISIHPPHVGWDSPTAKPPGRYGHFNPPTPCGVGPVPAPTELEILDISIHPPRVGWDVHVLLCRVRPRYFNPPTPCGVGL